MNGHLCSHMICHMLSTSIVFSATVIFEGFKVMHYFVELVVFVFYLHILCDIEISFFGCPIRAFQVFAVEAIVTTSF